MQRLSLNRDLVVGPFRDLLDSRMAEAPQREHLLQVARLWQLEGPISLIAYGENYIYLSEADELILRLTRLENRSLTQIAAAVHWVSFLGSAGVAVAHHRQSTSGESAHIVGEGGTQFAATVLERIDGTWIGPDDLSDELFMLWGQAIGEIHNANATYKPPAEQRPSLFGSDSYMETMEAHRDVETPGTIRDKFAEGATWLQSLSKDDGYGLVHGDHHPGNFCIEPNNRLVVFDFDDCHYGWYGYDLAVPIQHVLQHWDGGNPYARFDKIWENLAIGYERAGIIRAPGRAEIRRFLTFRLALMYLWCQGRVKRPERKKGQHAALERCMSFCLRAVE